MKNQARLNVFPEPSLPTETTELDPKACLSFTVEGALREIAKINIESKAIAAEIKPAQAYLNSRFHRLVALNKQRHTLDLFIFEDKLHKIPRGLSGLGAPGTMIFGREDFRDWLGTLSPHEFKAFQEYLGEKNGKRRS